jgi:hypothetical protein
MKSKSSKAAKYRNIQQKLVNSPVRVYRVAVKVANQEGWHMEPFVYSLKDYIRELIAQGTEVTDHRVVTEFFERPHHNGHVSYGHTTPAGQEGWKYDRFHYCWRAPDEAIKAPAWQLSDDELLDREASLTVLVPSSTRWTLEIFNLQGELIHEESETFIGTPGRNADRQKYNWKVGEYAESLGYMNGPFTSVWTIYYEVGGTELLYSVHRRSLQKVDGEWQVDGVKGPERKKPLIAIWPEYCGFYAWNEGGTAVSISYYFPQNSDVALVEAEFEENWLPRFEKAELDNEEHALLDWESFHEQGMRLAIRLKAVLGDQVDIVYKKPMEDPNRRKNEIRFVIVKSSNTTGI